MILLLLLIFVLGLVFGSFLNVVIYRTTHGASPLAGRSMCPKCKKKINWKYNIPLISFFLLGGRCANCKAKISWQYPVVEFLTGLLFLWWWLMGRSFFLLIDQPWSYIQPVFWLVTAMILLVIFVSDLRFGLIPDSANVALFILALAYRLGLATNGVMQNNDFVAAIISGLVLMAFFYFLWWVTRGLGFGFGDVKLAPGLGLLLGWPKILIAVFVAFVIGAVIALLLVLGQRKKMKQTIPFGPFLVLGCVIALLWGQDLWQWYWGMIN